MARVYLSSTIVDLKRERRAVLEWLLRARHQAVDSYLPNSETVRDSCLDDVDSCDLYVLILGHRYGFQPPDNNPEHLSITQLEFRRAGQSGIPRIALVRTSIPDVSRSDLADPERLALVSAFREEVAQEVRPAEFGDLRELIQGLSTGAQAELAKLDQRDSRPGGPGTGGPVLRLALRPEVLAGREELLAGLDDQLTDAGGSGPRVVTLTGLGGAGKTSVAVEYAHRHLDQVGVAWQLPAEDATVLAAGFTELAAQLGTGAVAGGGDPVAAVHSALAAYPGRWLLIFDNAPDQVSVQRFLPPTGWGRVLITSQSAVWPRGQAVEVPVLGTEVAAVFLVNRAGDPDSQAAAALAAELGGLPLALEQAAAYIQATGTTLAGYLTLFGDRRADLLASGEVAGHPVDMAATLGLALSQLEAEAPAAAGLLRLLACLAPEPVPLGLLLSDAHAAGDLHPDVAAVLGPLLADPVAVGNAITALRRYSLVSPAGDGLVLVHRLVQAVTLAQAPADVAGQWGRAAAALVSALADDLGTEADEDPHLWSRWRVLAPHAFHLVRQLEVIGERVDTQTVSQACRAAMLAARCLFALGLYEQAQNELDEVLRMARRLLGAEHPDVLAARHQLARVLVKHGQREQAETELKHVLKARRKVLGNNHPSTLATRNQLAWTRHVLGRDNEAEPELRIVLDARLSILGGEHRDTLVTRMDLAEVWHAQGRQQEAEDGYRTVLEARRRILGEDHPKVLNTRADLARLWHEQGRLEEAEAEYKAVVTARRRILGEDHPTTLTSRHDLASVLSQQGRRQDAEAQYRAVLDARCQVLGEDHPDTQATAAALAAIDR
jgi:tetratricopeptide (TPR) repeat protein